MIRRRIILLVALSFFCTAWCRSGAFGDEKTQSKVPRPSKAEIERWIKQLGDDRVQVRERATKALIAAGVPAARAVWKAATQSNDAEVRRRALFAARQIENVAAKAVEQRGGFVERYPDGWVELVRFKKEHPNRFSDADLVNVTAMPKIWNLDLEYTSITGAGFAFVRGTSTITRLNLSRTKVTDDALKHVGTLKNLETLYLDGAPINGPGVECLKSLEHLRYLNLSRTMITDDGLVAGIKGISDMRQLERLSFYRTSITDKLLAALGTLKADSLELFLTGTKISDVGVSHLKKIKGLVFVDLRETEITDKAIDELVEMTNLHGLRLRKTCVTIDALKKLERLPKLKHLYVEENGFSANDIARLQQSLPDVIIDWK